MLTPIRDVPDWRKAWVNYLARRTVKSMHTFGAPDIGVALSVFNSKPPTGGFNRANECGESYRMTESVGQALTQMPQTDAQAHKLSDLITHTFTTCSITQAFVRTCPSLSHSLAHSFPNITIVFGIVGSGPYHVFDGGDFEGYAVVS